MDSLAAAGVRVAWRAVSPGGTRREVAYALIREVVGDADLVVTQVCDRCGGDHGPVVVEGGPVRVSVAYARARVSGDEVAVVAVATGVAALGIDAEFEVDPVRDAAGIAAALGRESASIHDWVRVEAALKASGAGVHIDPSQVLVQDHPGSWTATVPGTAASFRGADLSRIPNLVVAVAYA